MPPVPAVPGATLRRALEKIGFEVLRSNGSHHVMKHPDGRHVVVPLFTPATTCPKARSEAS